ncbi:MAG: hypothetical protein IJT16_02100 [Lachnospiraceae bacterium]|nr:hypothetical protein [Lachnospiraceae bacterium]
MIEKILIEYLSEYAPVPVFMEKPDSPPESYVLIEKTGSNRSNRIETAMIAAQSYAGSMAEAAELNRLVKDLILDSVSLDEIGGISLNSDYNFTDTSTKEYRYQAVFNITYYGG